MSAELPGCVSGRWFCTEIEQPLYLFFRDSYQHLLRYSHKDYIEWDGKDCERLREEIRMVVRKREAGYPHMANSETLWFLLPKKNDKIDWAPERCNFADLGPIISAESKRPIPYTTDHRSDVATAARNLTYRSTDPHGLPMSNPNVVVDIRASKV